MCVIIHLPAKFDISFEKIENAVLNNPHGWGLIVKDRKKLIVRKECPENGNDPDTIYAALIDARESERFLHVRFNTVGATKIENTHPFTVYNSPRRQVEFMHNGTIYSYKPGAGSDLSDTRNYAENFVSPLLYRFKGEKGIADYTDSFFKQVIGQTFNTNRGLFIANDLDVLFLGDWKKVIDGDSDHSFMASNDDYFKKAETHRMHYSRKPVTTQQVLLPPTSANQGGGETKIEKKEGKVVITPLKDVKLERVGERKITTKDLDSLISWGTNSELQDLDAEDLTYFSYISQKEIRAWVLENPERSTMLLEFFFLKYAELYEEYVNLDEQRMKIVEKHEKASNLVASMQFELNELRKYNDADKIADVA